MDDAVIWNIGRLTGANLATQVTPGLERLADLVADGPTWSDRSSDLYELVFRAFPSYGPKIWTSAARTVRS